MMKNVLRWTLCALFFAAVLSSAVEGAEKKADSKNKNEQQDPSPVSAQKAWEQKTEQARASWKTNRKMKDADRQWLEKQINEVRSAADDDFGKLREKFSDLRRVRTNKEVAKAGDGIFEREKAYREQHVAEMKSLGNLNDADVAKMTELEQKIVALGTMTDDELWDCVLTFDPTTYPEKPAAVYKKAFDYFYSMDTQLVKRKIRVPSGNKQVDDILSSILPNCSDVTLKRTFDSFCQNLPKVANDPQQRLMLRFGIRIARKAMVERKVAAAAFKRAGIKNPEGEVIFRRCQRIQKTIDRMPDDLLSDIYSDNYANKTLDNIVNDYPELRDFYSVLTEKMQQRGMFKQNAQPQNRPDTPEPDETDEDDE